MSRFLRHRPSPAMLVAVAALIVSLGGTSYAALSLGRNSVGTRQLRNGAVTGPKIKRGAITAAKVADHSLTGRQIDARSLGRIPIATTALMAVRATNAVHATGADAAGVALRAGSAANGAQRIDFNGLAVDPAPANSSFSPATHTVLALDELTMRVSCIDQGSGAARVYVSLSSSAGAVVNFETITFENPMNTPATGGFDFTATEPTFGVVDLSGTGPGSGKADNGSWVYRSAARTITITMHVGVEDNGPAENCELQGTAVAAPS